MSLNVMLQNLRHRVSFAKFRDYLLSKKVSTATGWDPLIVNLNNAEKMGSDIVSEIRNILIDSYVVHNKSVTLYKIGPDIAALRSSIASLEISPNIFTEIFPGSMKNVNDIDVPAIDTWLPVSKIEREGGIGIIFSAIRKYERRSQVDQTDFPAEAKELLSSYDKLEGVKIETSQVFDTLWIPNSGEYVAILVDQPEGVSAKFANSGHVRVRELVRSLFFYDLKPMELFGAIGRIYATVGEGVVVELGFSTDASGVKSSKTRKGSVCIRKDLFQIGGSNAVDGNVIPYRIAVRWQSKKAALSVDMELALRGRFQMLSTSAPKIDSATVSGLWDTSDMNLIISKIGSYA